MDLYNPLFHSVNMGHCLRAVSYANVVVGVFAGTRCIWCAGGSQSRVCGSCGRCEQVLASF